MPTYQYRCTECGNDLEVVQKFTDDALTTCPECQGDLRKVFSAVGVVFKGSGFYATDSRKSTSATTPAKPDSPAKSDAPAAPTAKSESSTSTTTSSSSSEKKSA